MARIYAPENQVILDRIDNWVRFYRPVQRILAVPYYSPPTLGDVHEQELFVKLPIHMQDACELELVWRNMDNGSAKKWYIKWRYILKIQHNAI